MPLKRAIVGAVRTGQQITWSDEDGTAKDLTGTTITGTIEDSDGNTTAIAGTLNLVTAASGIFNWAYAAADIATAGRYTVQFKADDGADYDLTFPEAFVVERAL